VGTAVEIGVAAAVTAAAAETETEEALAAVTDQDTKASSVEKINFFLFCFL
jgi:hypothetical protein